MSDEVSIIDDIFSGYSSWPKHTVSGRKRRARYVPAFLAWIWAIPAVGERDGYAGLLERGRRTAVHLVVERGTEDDSAERPEGVHCAAEAVGTRRRASRLGMLIRRGRGDFETVGSGCRLV